MAAPAPSRLDANQVLQGAFDEATGRLRTDAEATVVNADLVVDIDAADGDNIAITDPDTGDSLQIESDGSINVNVNIDSADGDNISIKDSDGNELEINPDGSINTVSPNPPNAVITSLNASLVNQIALPINLNRKGAIFFKSGTGVAFIKLGTIATSTDYTVQLTNNTAYELPYPAYTGRIDVIFSSTNGTMKITEIF